MFFCFFSDRKRSGGKKELQEAVVESNTNQSSSGRKTLVLITLSLIKTLTYWPLSSYMKVLTENVVQNIILWVYLAPLFFQSSFSMTLNIS